MGRVKRWAINIITGVSLLLCIATAFLWVRSFSVWDACDSDITDSQKQVTDSLFASTRSGRLFLSRDHLDHPDAFVYAHRFQWQILPYKFPRALSLRTFWQVSISQGRTAALLGSDGRRLVYDGSVHAVGDFRVYGHANGFTLPLIWIVALAGALPTLRVVRWVRRARRRPAGCCTDCGYNLTANVSGICPECGKAV